MIRKIKGQKRAVGILEHALEHDKIGNSYLFYGPSGTGKFTTALYFGMALNCTSEKEKRPCRTCNSCRKFLNLSHPDLTYIFPTPNLKMTIEGEIKETKVIEEYRSYLDNKRNTPWKEFFFSKNTEIRIDSIRMLEHNIYLSPNEAEKKIYIIEDADEMNQQAANAFLKTLEEPPVDSVIILTTDRMDALLPTIVSRCQKVQFLPLSRHVIESELITSHLVEEQHAKLCARIANGNMERAIRLSQIGGIASRELTIDFLQLLINRNDTKFMDLAIQFKKGKQNSLLYELISHLIIWFCDAAYYQNYPSEIVNVDKIELLSQIVKINPQIDNEVVEILDYLESTQRKFEAFNLNPYLTIINLYITLGNYLYRMVRRM